jgi:hypothetical protein
MASFIITSEGLTLFHDGDAFQVTQDNPKWEEVVQAITDEDWEVAATLANPIKAVTEYVRGNFKIKDRRVWLDEDTEMHGALAERIISMHEQGFPIKPMALFIENLNSNPSNRAVEELYRFLEAAELPITSDGHFMAYKRVNANFKDQYTNTIDNSPGQVVEMPRNKVNDDCRQTCSHGLHFAARSYVSNFGGAKLVSIKINPRDVVSIPVDYNNAKGRCCRYEVIAELDLQSAIDGEEAFKSAVFEAPEPEPEEPRGTGTTRCAHCQNLMSASDSLVEVTHEGASFIVHKVCEKAFYKCLLEEDGAIDPTCAHCKTPILTTQSSLGIGGGKVVHDGCYNEYRSNRDRSGSA